MDYYEIDEKRILSLMDGLGMIERLNAEKASELNLCLYGLTTDSSILSAAKEIIMENLEDYWNDDGVTTLSEDEITLSEIGISIPLSSDTISTLFSRYGLETQGLDFAYISSDERGEGVRDERFDVTSRRTRIAFGTLQHPVLAEDSYNLKSYVAKYKSGQPMAVSKRVEREKPATILESPVSAPPVTQAPPTGMVRESSVKNIKEVVETFLDRRS